MRCSQPKLWWCPFKRIDDIEVFHVDLAPNDDFEAMAFGWLDANERERWRRFLFPGPKRRFALCRAALRREICDRVGCRNGQLMFNESEHGKPFAVVDGRRVPISFNVTHSGQHGLIAFGSTKRLGIDIEERTANRHIELLSETVFGPNERRELGSVAGQRKIELFFNLWTVKEALVKALGVGMSLDTSEFEVPLSMRCGAERGVFTFPHMPEVKWQLEDLSNERFAAAIAYELSSETLNSRMQARINGKS